VTLRSLDRSGSASDLAANGPTYDFDAKASKGALPNSSWEPDHRNSDYVKTAPRLGFRLR